MKVKVLVLPILGRYWLYHAWKETPPAGRVVKNWKEGSSLQEKASLLISSLQAKASKTAEEQWHKLEKAPAGTFNNTLFRFAQWAMSKVDPSEAFLKALPPQAQHLDIIYPASLPERLVRRRLRLLAAKAVPFHSSRLRVWSAALVPQLPLIPLPLPNVTIYYTVWRMMSNRSAGRGARELSAALELHSDQQRQHLAQQLQQLQHQGVVLKKGSWAERLAAEASTSQSQVHDASQPAVSGGDNTTRRLPLPYFCADEQLEKLVLPQERRHTPLPESAVTQLANIHQQHHLLEHYKAANRRCLGNKQQQQTQQPMPQTKQHKQAKPERPVTNINSSSSSSQHSAGFTAVAGQGHVSTMAAPSKPAPDYRHTPE